MKRQGGLKNQPVRVLALESSERADAELAFIGHFMKDKFVWCADLATIGWPRSKGDDGAVKEN